MPRGPGKKENYNFDYSRFRDVDADPDHEKGKGKEKDTLPGGIPTEVLRQLPSELQEAFRLMQISRQTGDEAARIRANELAVAAVERGGPEMKQKFQQEVMRQCAKSPESKRVMEDILNRRGIGQAAPGGEDLGATTSEKVDSLASSISQLQTSMKAGAESTTKHLEALKKQQEWLGNITGPEDFMRFLSEQGVSEEVMQKAIEGDETAMRKACDGAMSSLEPAELQTSMRCADAMVGAVDTLHKQLTGEDTPDSLPPAAVATLRPLKDREADEAEVRKRRSAPPAPEPKIAEHRVEYKKDEGGRLQEVQLRCELPGVQAMTAIELDVSERYLRVRTTAPAPLYVVNVGPFPALVDPAAARAKFSKKAQELKLTVSAKP